MTARKLFAALVLLILHSTILYTLYNSIRFQTARAAPIENTAKTARISCIHPITAEESVTCADMEAQILVSTVRIELQTWGSVDGHQKQLITESHGTILDGKYLVTHNHFIYSLTEQVELFGEKNGYTGVSIRTTGGSLLLENGALDSFSIVYEDAEVLVLAFVDDKGLGLFETANLPAAKFADMQSFSLRVGDELAQIDWDGTTTHVDWVQVDNVILSDNIPQIQMNNFPLKGSSGGGVFLNGVHVGINWMRNTKMNQATGEITGRYSTVVLNSLTMMELSQ